MIKRKRLFFDIETAPNIGLFFEAGYKKNINYQSIIKERAIICICYKWEDCKDVHYLTWDAKQCDKKMLIEFIKVANSADEIIGHNSIKFDLAWIRTRCLFHRIHMPPNYVSIDTLNISRSKFRFNSNRLDYIAQYLGMGQKIKTDFNLWKDILLHKDKLSLDKMVKYCKMDVILLEKIYKELSNHVENKTHYGVIFGGERGSCPECGSEKLHKQREFISSSGLKKIRYLCHVCQKYCTKNHK